MAGQYDNELKGVLFRNTRQREGKQDPDMQGNCEIDGREYWVDGWTNEGKEGSKIAGKKFLSLKFRPKEARPSGARPADDDDIPF